MISERGPAALNLPLAEAIADLNRAGTRGACVDRLPFPAGLTARSGTSLLAIG